jgi:hypothetical protein
MVEPPAQSDAEYQRGQAIIRRWGWPIGIVGTVGFLTYLGLMFFQARHPDPDTGRIYAIFNLGGRHSPLFTYGTFTVAALAYGGLAVGVLGLTVFFTLRYIYDPGANRRSLSAPAPKNPADWR